MKARIAIVAPGLEVPGGQGIQAHLLIEGLRADGWDVVHVPVEPRLPAGLRWLRSRRYVRTLANQVMYLPSLAALRHVDVVHVFSASYWSFLLAPVPAMVAARALGKRVVLHYHSGEAEDHLRNWGVLVHPWLRLADQIAVPSTYLQETFVRHGHPARVIPNVVDVSRFRYRPRRPLRPCLLSTRNFEAHYRVENTLAAFALLRRRYPDATLTLAGCGSLEAGLRSQAAAIGGGVHFAGRVEPAAMPALYDRADIFLNSSVVDNQPVSVLEAFAAGTPVVSTSTGDIAALVRPGETGVVVPAENPEAMAGAVSCLVESPEGALVMARRAWQEATRHTWPAVRQAWADVYEAAEMPAARPEALPGRLASRSGR